MILKLRVQQLAAESACYHSLLQGRSRTHGACNDVGFHYAETAGPRDWEPFPER
jgi:hypothetical protein